MCPGCRQSGSVWSAGNFKKVIKTTKSPSAFYYHYAPTILNHASDQIPPLFGSSAPNTPNLVTQLILCPNTLHLAVMRFLTDMYAPTPSMVSWLYKYFAEVLKNP